MGTGLPAGSARSPDRPVAVPHTTRTRGAPLDAEITRPRTQRPVLEALEQRGLLVRVGQQSDDWKVFSEPFETHTATALFRLPVLAAGEQVFRLS
jgi:hypothetical protein